ncbi:hypothetical protein RGQ15_20010 [Paracoccus sp. MBLB3053]|uniref:Uncharacterized protein n=1 Tax=Paracoccus aurantius TaxID=3073814 RepID=A0ABU2HXT2_9RHOB|nr:hypothetical protein [Paracoccus sp. MBLB3053]MDS9469848.1 hypothetical protein [Paracoccus sp. MBLB3053]
MPLGKGICRAGPIPARPDDDDNIFARPAVGALFGPAFVTGHVEGIGARHVRFRPGWDESGKEFPNSLKEHECRASQQPQACAIALMVASV